MEVLRGIEELGKIGGRPVATLGVFDGVHIGHRAVIEAAVGWADRVGQSSALITFDVHPRKALRSGAAASVLTAVEHRLRLFDGLGIDAAAVLPFSEISRMSAERFARDVLAGALRACGVVLGHDARFGRDRGGDVGLLRALAARLGFEVREVEAVRFEGAPVSSTRIRGSIEAGRLDEAAAMLGRRVSVMGTVVKGTGRGRRMGYPTANLDVHSEVSPPPGIYATAIVVDGARYLSASSIGPNPTFRDAEPTIEAHLIDFSGDLYGREVELVIVKRMRDSVRFESPEALAGRIELDVAEARRILAAEGLG